MPLQHLHMVRHLEQLIPNKHYRHSWATKLVQQHCQSSSSSGDRTTNSLAFAATSVGEVQDLSLLHSRKYIRRSGHGRTQRISISRNDLTSVHTQLPVILNVVELKTALPFLCISRSSIKLAQFHKQLNISSGLSSFST